MYFEQRLYRIYNCGYIFWQYNKFSLFSRLKRWRSTNSLFQGYCTVYCDYDIHYCACILRPMHTDIQPGALGFFTEFRVNAISIHG